MKRVILSFVLGFIYSYLGASNSTALNLFNQNQYLEAIKIWKDDLQKQPTEKEILYYNIGTAYAKWGKYPQAIFYLERSLKYNYNNSSAHLNLAIARAKYQVDINTEPPIFEHFLKKMVFIVSLPLLQYISIFCSWAFLILYYLYSKKIMIKLKTAMIAVLFILCISWIMCFCQNYFSKSSKYAIAHPYSDWYSDATLQIKKRKCKGGEKIEILDRLDSHIQIRSQVDSVFWVKKSDITQI